MLSEGVKGTIYYIDLSCVCCCKCFIGEYGIMYTQIDFHMVSEYRRTSNQTRSTVMPCVCLQEFTKLSTE